ncbi:acetylcholine receptor subunit delta-like [Ostrea edulis]|uniref:acetylcholine receptor subunit delta-like n=1 Tax=Ostrea edulis TaxID=37623 RepID=UPI0024AF18CE|nr:acetylcholine receptor subunit delta-like [Ostrea edulis]
MLVLRVILLSLCDLILLSGSSIDDYKQLQKSLMADYSNKIRPVYDQDETIYIFTTFYLSSIVEVDAVQQRLVTTAHLGIIWTDELLQWDESSTGVERLYFKQKDIWTPDVVLMNGVKEFEELGGDFYYVEVVPDGTVYWYPYQIFESKCDIDITYFPFDTQICNFIFVSWSFLKSELNITLYEENAPIDYYDYVQNSVWDIVHSTSPEYEADAKVTFTLTLRRKPQYYVMNLILPVVLLGVISLLVFVIPADAGEKMSFAVTVFLAFAVFLSIISMQLPVNSEKTSMLGVYLIFQMTLGVGTIILSSFQLRIHYRKSERKVGKFYRGIVTMERFLRCKICLKPSHQRKSNRQSFEQDAYFDDVNWNDVSSAFDFFCFWVMLLLEMAAIIIFVMNLI